MFDFFVIGAQKCGTSWLYYCLKNHREISMPNKKNDNEYIKGDVCSKKEVRKYKNQVTGNNANSMVGDISVNYITNQSCPKLIRHYMPKTKFIVLIRDPIERAVSAYYQYLREGRVKNVNVNKGLRVALNKTKKSNETGLSKKKYGVYEDIMYRGMYINQLNNYANHFDTEKILVLPYQAIKNQKEELMREIYEFLGVDADCSASIFARHRIPKKNSYIGLLLRAQRDTPNVSVMNKIFDISHQIAYISGLHKDRPQLSDDVRGGLIQFYSASVERLSAQMDNYYTPCNLWKNVEWNING